MNSLYDASKVGPKIADGGNRKVFAYGENQVIKFSAAEKFIALKLHRKLSHDYELAKKYLPDFVVPTEDVTGSDNQHIELQPRIQGEGLRTHHLASEKVRAQFAHILRKMEHMQKDGHPELDLVGLAGGLFDPHLNNVFIDADNNLHIIDTMLFEGKALRPFGILFELLLIPARARQHQLIRRFVAASKALALGAVH
jgi:hypothetical protein